VLKGYEGNSIHSSRLLDLSLSVDLFGLNCKPLSQIVPACAGVQFRR
jgi:hypothetical protein